MFGPAVNMRVTNSGDWGIVGHIGSAFESCSGTGTFEEARGIQLVDRQARACLILESIRPRQISAGHVEVATEVRYGLRFFAWYRLRNDPAAVGSCG
jgi:hypothetical protein